MRFRSLRSKVTLDTDLKRIERIEAKLEQRALQEQTQRQVTGGALRDAAVEGASAIGGVVGTAVGDIPGGLLGTTGGTLVASLALDRGNRLLTALTRRGLSPREAHFYVHHEAEMTQKLIAGLNKLVEQSGRVVIMFDTYEQAPEALRRWVTETFLSQEVTSITSKHPLLLELVTDYFDELWRRSTHLNDQPPARGDSRLQQKLQGLREMVQGG